MEGREVTPQRTLEAPSAKEINKTRRKFLKVLRHLPQENQDFITEMTSYLTEPDIERNFKSNPQEIEDFRRQLAQMGLGESPIKIVFNYFNLPYEKKA